MPADEQFKPKPVSVAVASLSTIPKAALLLIGPEGDFSLPEKQALVAANCVVRCSSAIALQIMFLPMPHNRGDNCDYFAAGNAFIESIEDRDGIARHHRRCR